MDSSFWFNTITLGWSIVHIEGSHVITICIFFLLSLKILLILANMKCSIIRHFINFGLQYLLKYLFMS